MSANIEARRDEIFALVGANELHNATARLMDFVKDFGNDRKFIREVTLIRADYNAWREKTRMLGEDEAARREMKGIANHVVTFCDAVFEAASQNPQPAPNASNAQAAIPGAIPQRTDRLGSSPISQPPPEFVASREITDVAFQGRKVAKEYKGSSVKFKLQPIDLDLRLGEITALVGENGNGKSTLLRMIAGDLAASSGELDYPYMRQCGATDLYQIKQKIAYISQELPHWHGSLIENLLFTAAIHGASSDENVEQTTFVISRLGLDRYAMATWNEISGGYRMRFSLAKALLRRPKLLVLDEPLSSLDVNTQLLFLQDLRNLANSLSDPIAVVVSSQHLHEIEAIADRIVFLKNGSARYNGSVADFGSNRTENVFEIVCELSKERLADALEGIEYKRIEMAGANYIVYIPVAVTAEKFIAYLVSHGVRIRMFQDISRSTRKLFEQGSL